MRPAHSWFISRAHFAHNFAKKRVKGPKGGGLARPSLSIRSWATNLGGWARPARVLPANPIQTINKVDRFNATR